METVRSTRGMRPARYGDDIMPAPANNRRVKNKSISRAFVIGSEATVLPPVGDPARPKGIPENYTHSWKVYVRGVEGGPDINAWLKKVQFKIYHTYENPVRMIESPPFEIHESGWGGFSVEIRLYFQPEVSEKPQWRTHYLQLLPYGSEKEQKQQRDAGRVVSEQYDFVDFNEPTEALWDRLTDPGQWDYLTKGQGRGKGKGAGKGGAKGRGSLGGAGAMAGNGVVPPEERTVELPERNTAGSLFSKETEEQVLAVLAQARKEVEAKLAEVEERRRGLAGEMEELQRSGDLPVKKKA